MQKNAKKMTPSLVFFAKTMQKNAKKNAKNMQKNMPKK